MRDLFVDRFQTSVVFLKLGEVGDGFVQQIVAEHDGIISVLLRNTDPDISELILAFRAFIQPWVAVAVIDVCAGLAAGSTVHIQDDPNLLSSACIEDGVQQIKAVAACNEELPMQGNTH